MTLCKKPGSIDLAFTRRQVLSGTVAGLGGTALCLTSSWAAGANDVTHSGEAIHQENRFKTSPQRVYKALTESEQFHRVVLLSAAMRSGLPPGALPTEISREEGGVFTLFAGHIVGRQLELVPGKRIVQAWRVVDWEPGAFSIAKFQLSEEGSSTRLVFDHTGFPKGLGEHLAEGWTLNYWEPLGKFLIGSA